MHQNILPISYLMFNFKYEKKNRIFSDVIAYFEALDNIQYSYYMKRWLFYFLFFIYMHYFL